MAATGSEERRDKAGGWNQGDEILVSTGNGELAVLPRQAPGR